MLIPVLLFIVGLILLIKGGGWFVSGATGIAQKFHVPELLIGATVVSIGTTLPEVMVSAASALSGHGEIAYGNAIGSIICNTALIAAITVAVRPSRVERDNLKIPVVFFFTAAAFYMVISYTGGHFSRLTGILLLLLFAVYMFFSIRKALSGPQPEVSPVQAPEASIAKNILLLIIGAAFIAVGADLLVDNGTIIARELGVPESVIALTIVAVGTSLPELVTALTSLIKGHSALSLGNIIGANLFNLVLVSGLSITLAPFDIPASKMIAGRNASLVVDLPLMVFVMAILTLPALKRSRLSRAQGIILLCIYAGFCYFQFAL